VLQLEVFIFETRAIDGLSTSSVMVGKIPPLAHKAGDNSVERRAGVAEALLPSTKGPEIFGGLGDDVRTELHDDSTRWLVADGNVEVALWVGPGKRSD